MNKPMNDSKTDRDIRNSRKVGERVSHGRSERLFILADGIRRSNIVLETFQDLPACPSHRSGMKMKTLE
jgi:hypothetical protein